MAATTRSSRIRIITESSWGNDRVVTATVDGPGNYDSTNKLQVPAKSLNLSRIRGFTATNAITKSTGAPANHIEAYPDKQGPISGGRDGFSKIVVVYATAIIGATEVSNDTDLTATQFWVTAWGDAGGAY